MASLADRYQARIDREGSFRTPKKFSPSGKRVGGGTLVTQSTVNAIRGDEIGNVIILENNSELIAHAIRHAVAVALEEIGLVAEAYAKKLCPVDTGRLRNSITHAITSVDNNEVYIGTNVSYAPYVENGTSRREGAHFLRGAAQDHGDRYRAILEKHLQNG